MTTAVLTQEQRDYVDWVVVERVLAGRRPDRVTEREVRACVERMHALRYSDALMGQLLGKTAGAVATLRRRMGLPAWPYADAVHCGDPR